MDSLFIGDNLPVLRNLNSASVDLIYLDPPFNSNRNYTAVAGTRAEGMSFQDKWAASGMDWDALNLLQTRHRRLWRVVETLGDIGTRGDRIYLVFMALRLQEMHHLLKTTGNLYLHCDPSSSHYLKVILDSIFGRGNFINEIVWNYSSVNARKSGFGRKHDILLLYARNSGSHVYNWDEMREPYASGGKWASGKPIKFKEGHMVKGNTKGKLMSDVWYIPSVNNAAKERTGYPTQKPLALLTRIIKASSNKGEVVLDPFCGSGTTLVAAEQLGRRWIGMESNPDAEAIIRERLSGEVHITRGGEVPEVSLQKKDKSILLI